MQTKNLIKIIKAEATVLVSLIENLPDDGATLPGTYLNCTAFDNVADWSLKVGGEDTKRYRIAYSNGAISVLPVGTVILFR